MAHLTLSTVLWFAVALIVAASLLLGIALLVRLFGRTQAAGREAQQLLQLLIDDAIDYALVVLDPTGRVAQWNSGAQRIHGYEGSEIIGRHCSCFFTDEDRAANLPQKVLEIAARQGQHAISGQRVRKGGRRLLADLVIHALRDRSGRLIGFSSIERDITDDVQQRQALIQTRAALLRAQKMAALGRLGDGIAHEFNNVVHVIKTCVEALQRNSTASAQMTEFLQMIKRNAERGAGLSQHLQSLARRPPRSPTLTNVNEVVADVVELLRHALSENIVLELRVGDDLSWAIIDPNQLEAALVNLAANARDAMPYGGTLLIEAAELILDDAAGQAEGAKPGHYVMIMISNTDNGTQRQALIPAAESALTPASPELGMDDVRSFVEQSGGYLRVDRQGDRRTRVRLYLPCRAG